jgi:hypothetical protein
MEIAIGIASILVGILIAIIPYFRRKYFLRPELTIEIINDAGSSLSRGLSSKNKVNEEGYIEGDAAIRVFELTWRFKIRITNNSDLTAFYPDLEFNPNGPKFTLIDKLNTFEPIKPAETVELKAEYKKYEEKTAQERTDIGSEMPKELNELWLLLGYQNSKKIKFHTLYGYDKDGNKNKLLSKRPKEYRNN